MKNLKRVGVTVLLVVGVTLFTSMPALAGKNADDPGTSIKLQGSATVEPNAMGTASLTEITYDDTRFAGSGKLTVNCRRLTPGKSYVVRGTSYDLGTTLSQTVEANSKGEVRCLGTASWSGWDVVYEVTVSQVEGPVLLWGALSIWE
jgi:hypothetical protein